MRQLACAVVTNDEGKVLLVLREDFDVWCLPGGHVEPGETHEEAARRETREETHVEITVDALVGRYLRGGPLGDATSLAFAGRIVRGVAAPDGVESLDVGWFAPERLPPMLWWNKPPVIDFFAGRRDVERQFDVDCRHGAIARADLYALRDRSGLTRRAFYEDAFPEPDLIALLGRRPTYAMVDVKVVGPDDWATWRSVRLAALSEAPGAFGASLADWEHADEDRWRDRLTTVPFNVVAVTNGAPVGQASGTELDEGGWMELISMWVAPAVRGQGVADALIGAVRDEARRLGAATLRLSVRRDNGRAIAAYRRLGFLDDGPGDEDSEAGMTLPLGH